ncbi:MAG TPA: hypothetical protein VMG82_33785 [Candidatus Sulfotelmatobacter sp.]|nr:hypothetical protein [Candidatus Sulfotelmatobacter sp.]
MPGSKPGAEIVVALEGTWDFQIDIASSEVASVDHQTLFWDFSNVGNVFAQKRYLLRRAPEGKKRRPGNVVVVEFNAQRAECIGPEPQRGAGQN